MPEDLRWGLPPHISWPHFLRLLRHPSPPKGWLEEASLIEDVARRPQLLRWIAKHRQAPAHLRLRLLPRLPWRILALIADDPSAHPQAKSLSIERLTTLWNTLGSGERRSLARFAPKNLWLQIWKTRQVTVLKAFLEHPKLGIEGLLALIQCPLNSAQAESLLESRFQDILPIIEQTLWIMDQSFEWEPCDLVLGHAAPWIRKLKPEEALFVSSRMSHPPLRRMTRSRWEEGT